MLLRILICVLFVTFLFTDLEAKILKQKVRNGIEYTIKSSDSNDIVMKAEARLVDGEKNDLIASAQMAKDGNSTGWNRLQVWTNINYTEQYGASSAGELEACLSTGLIAQYWYNTVNTFCVSQQETCNNLKKFISDNYNWTLNKIAEEKDTSAYWYQVNLVYLQIEGMYNGYKVWKEETEPDISFEDFQLMNLLGDLTDLIEKFKPETGVPNKLIQEGHSSALIKLLPDYAGLLAGHSTSGSYSSMTRIAKRYELHYQISEDNTTEVNSGIITLSGYPGVVHSGDEFYSLSKGFVVQKSTIFNSNKALWNKVNPEEMVFGSVRLMVANRLAHCGKSWSSIFSQYNSGTSNGQYMFINYNRFQQGQPPQQGLLWVLEQLPGSIVAQDQTPHLNATSYWASYNIPYYNDIYKLSGNDKLAKKYGSLFSHTSSPRAKIFKRDHSDISCCCGMMALLRYNNYKHDPLSKCKCRPGGYSASNAIAPRQDLNSAKGRYPISYFGRHAGGSIDGKVITSQLVETQQFKAQSGPTIGSLLPPFKWSTSGFDTTVRHLGQTDEWNFGTQLIQWFD